MILRENNKKIFTTYISLFLSKKCNIKTNTSVLSTVIIKISVFFEFVFHENVFILFVIGCIQLVL